MLIVIATIIGTLSIFLFNAILAIAYLGLGLTLRRAFGLMQATIEDCFAAFWMGFGLIIAFLLVWNMILPAGGGVPLSIVLIAGITGIVVTRRSILSAFRAASLPFWSVIAAALFGLWVSNLSLGRMTAWDSALYQMQGVKWASSYRVLPGLANIFGPVGFNNASLVHSAMLDAGPWEGHAWHVANGVLVSVFGAQLIIVASGVLGRNRPKRSIYVLALLLLPAAVAAAHDGVPNFMTVVPASLLIMVAVILAHKAFVDNERSARERAYDFFCISFLGAVTVSIKTSGAVFAALILVVSCYGVLSLGREANRVRTLVWMFTAVGVVGVAWAIRGIILSGYPLFPSPFLPFPVDWRVPAEHARAEYDFVVHSARATTENFGFVSGRTEGLSAWLPNWVYVAFENPYEMVVPAGMAMATSLFFLSAFRRATSGQLAAIRSGWWILAVLGITVTAWFLIAPMPSYGAPFFWSIAALIGTQAYGLLPRSRTFTTRLFLAMCFLSLTPLPVNPIWASRWAGQWDLLSAVVDANLKIPDTGHWYQLNKPPDLTGYRTRTGIGLNVPVGYFGRCWDAPLPCTPNPAPNLRLRAPGRIEGGFSLDGDWQMQDWPEPWRPQLLPALREGWRKRDASSRQSQPE